MQYSNKILIPSAPEYVHFELTYKCNCNCSFCYNSFDHIKNDEMNLAQKKLVIDKLSEKQIFAINFTGGEPLMDPDFFRVTEYAFERGLQLHLNTNGTLVNELNYKKLARIFPRICVTLLGPNSTIHDHMTNCQGSFQLLINGIQLLVDEGVDVQIHMTVTKTNINYVLDNADLAQRLGIKWFLASRVVSVGKGLNVKHLQLSNEDVERLLLNLEEIEFRYGLNIALPSPIPLCTFKNHLNSLIRWNIPCNVGFLLACISPNGDVRPCTLYSQILGNILETSFIEIWQADMLQKYRNFEHYPEHCQKCGILSKCRSGCSAAGLCSSGFLNSENSVVTN